MVAIVVIVVMIVSAIVVIVIAVRAVMMIMMMMATMIVMMPPTVMTIIAGHLCRIASHVGNGSKRRAHALKIRLPLFPRSGHCRNGSGEATLRFMIGLSGRSDRFFTVGNQRSIAQWRVTGCRNGTKELTYAFEEELWRVRPN